MIAASFLTLAAILGLADILGTGHDWGATGAALVLFLFCWWLEPGGWNRLLATLLWLSVGVAAMAVGQVLINAGINFHLLRARGPFNSPNYLGAYAVLMFFLAVAAFCPFDGKWGFSPLNSPRQKTMWVVAAANLLSLALSQSRGALLALGAGVAVMAARGRSWPLLAVPAACAAAIFLIRPGNEEARLQIWSIGIQVAWAHPWLGWGQGGVGMPGYGGFYSAPLDLLIEAGLLGLLAGAWLLVAAWRAAPDHRPFLAAWLVQGLFLSGTPATWLLLVAVLGHLSFNVPDRPLSAVSTAPRGLSLR